MAILLLFYFILYCYGLHKTFSLAERLESVINDCYNINRTELCGVCGHTSSDIPEKCTYPFGYRFSVEDRSGGKCHPSSSDGSCNHIDSYCKSDSCLNGGTCLEGFATFRCKCSHTHYGMRCEQEREQNKKYAEGIQVFLSQQVKFNTNATVIISTDVRGSDLFIKMESDLFQLNYVDTPVPNLQHYTPEMREQFCKEKTGLSDSQCRFIRYTSNDLYTMMYNFPAIGKDQGPMIYKGTEYPAEESARRIGYIANLTITAYQIKRPTLEKLPHVQRDYKPVFSKDYKIFVYYNNQTFCVSVPKFENQYCSISPQKRQIYAPSQEFDISFAMNTFEGWTHLEEGVDYSYWVSQCHNRPRRMDRRMNLEVIVRSVHPHFFEKDSKVLEYIWKWWDDESWYITWRSNKVLHRKYSVETGIISYEMTGIVDLIGSHPHQFVEALNKSAGLPPPNFSRCYFEIRRELLIPNINEGINQTYYVNTQDGLIINAQRSTNLNRRDRERFMKWSCKLGNTTTPCFTEYMFNDTADYFKIDPNILIVDRVYNFSLRLYEKKYELTTSFAFVAVDVGSNKPFVIRLTCPECWSGMIARHNDYNILVLKHEGKIYKLKELKYKWQYRDVHDISFKSANDIRVNQTEDYIFKIEKNALQHSRSYQFHVSIEDVHPPVYSALTIRITNKHVQSCDVNPKTGFSGITLFNIECNVMPDDGVTYVYEFFNKGVTDEEMFSGRMLGTSTNGDLYKFRLTREFVTVACFDSQKVTDEIKVTVQLEQFNKDETYIDGLIAILKTDATFEATGVFHLENSQRDLALPSAIAEILTPDIEKTHLLKDLIYTLTKTQMLHISEIKLCLSSIRNILVAMSGPVFPKFTIAADVAKQCADVLLRITTNLVRRVDHAEIEKTITESICHQLTKYVLDTIAVIVRYKNKEVSNNIEEFVNPIVLDMVQQTSNEMVESLDQISHMLLRLRTPGDTPSEIRSLRDEITSWVKAGHPEDVHHVTASNKSLPLRISKDLAATMKDDYFIGVQFIRMNVNPFWWAGGYIVTEVLSVILCSKKSYSVDYKKIHTLPFPIQLNFNINKPVQSIKPISGEAKQLLQSMSDDEKDLSLVVYRFDPPARAKLFVTFLFEENNGEYMVLFKKNVRPDCNDMTHDAFLISGDNPTYKIVYEKNNDDIIYYMGILPVNSMGNDDNTNISSFKLKIYYAKCNIWLKWQWTDRGCWVGEGTSDTILECNCSHLSLFAGTVWTPQNDMFALWDFKLFLTPQVNYLPFITMLFIIVIYIVLFIWSMSRDKKDINRVNIIILEDNYPDEKYGYLIALYTGSRIRSGTNANVGIKLLGTQEESRPHILKSSVRRTLRTNSDDWFLIFCPNHLGNLTSLHLWHDNTTNNPDWFLDQVKVFDLKEELEYMFYIYEWIAFNSDMFPEILVSPAGLKDCLKKKQTFADNLVVGFRDSHYWTSVLWRHPRDPLTRIYRLQVVFCFVTTAMAVSLLLYLSRYTFPSDEDKPSYKLTSFDYWALLLSLLSALIISSVTMCLLSKSFSCMHERNRSSLVIRQEDGRKSSFEEKFMKKKSSHFANLDIVLSNSKIDENFVEVKDQRTQDKEGAVQTLRAVLYRTIRKTPLAPAQLQNTKSGILVQKHCLVCFWLVCVITTLICCFVVLIFGWSMESVHGYQWLTIFIMTIIIDIFVFSILKIIISSALLSILFKRMIPIDIFHFPPKEIIDNKLFLDSDHLNKTIEIRRQNMYLPLSHQKKDEYLEKLYRRLRWEMILVFVIIILFLTVMAMVTAIFTTKVYSSNRHAMSMMSHGHFTSNQPRFQDIFNRTDVEDFLQYNFISQLYRFLWYNLKPLVGVETRPIHRLDWADDSVMRLVGNAYLRQLRVIAGTCPTVRHMKNVSERCTPAWSERRMDKDGYYIGWTSHPDNNSLMTTTAWAYSPPDGFSSSRCYGASGTKYPEGGYFSHLGYKKRETQYVVSKLIKDLWLDSLTRALFVELTLYNVNTNLFSHVTLIAEQLPTGEFLPRVQVETISIDASFNVWHISFIVFLLLFTIRTLLQINKFGSSHVLSKNIHRLEILIICLAYCSVVMYFVHLYTAFHYVGEYQRKGVSEFFSFNQISKYVYLFETVTFLLFVCLILRLICSFRFGRIFLRFFYTLYLSRACLIWLILGFLISIAVLWRLLGYLIQIFVFLNRTSIAITVHPNDLYVFDRTIGIPLSSNILPLSSNILLAIIGVTSTTVMMIFITLFAHFYKMAQGYKIADVDNYNFLEFLSNELKQIKDARGKGGR